MSANVAMLTEAQILAIPADRPERLFSGTEDQAKLEWRRLRSKWHPDTNAVNPGVMTHINALYERAVALIEAGQWRGSGQILIEDVRGRAYTLSYLKAEPFELGHTYIGRTIIAYKLGSDYADLVRIAQDHCERFAFPDTAMRIEHEKHLPKLQQVIEVKDGYYVVFSKHADYLRLSDVLEHFGGVIEQRHVAWILSTLYNLNCFMKLSGIVHHDIAPRNYFINAKEHDGALLGGWWYARHEGERLIALPQRTIQYGPPSLLTDKIAASVTNSELIKATGRELLGDIIGSRFASMNYPKALVMWLRGTAHLSAFEEYGTWSRSVLTQSYGARKFVELKLGSNDIYTR